MSFLKRRHLLQGLGATLALPWLESLSWSLDESADSKPPIRFGTLLFANGVNPYEWWAKGEGESLELSSTLKPLEPFKRHITVLRELHVYNNTSGPHWPLFSNFLSGAQFKQSLIPQGAGTTLLDNAMLLFGSNMFNGDSHDGRNLPLVLAGHGGGAIAGGRAIDFADKPEEQQRACNLYLTLARTMGLELKGFGDSIAALEGLG